MKRILTTGSRDWQYRGLIHRALATQGEAVYVHGAARGADSLVDMIARSLGYPTEGHPTDWEKHGKPAGGIRNQRMVDLGADLCLAFPMPGSIGTFDCIVRCERAGIKVIPVLPPVLAHVEYNRLLGQRRSLMDRLGI